MFIIWGCRHQQSTVGQDIFACPTCRSQVPCDLKEARPYFTLFFIPVFPVGGVERFVACRICGSIYPPAVLVRSPSPSPSVGEGTEVIPDVLPANAASTPGSPPGWPTTSRLRGVPIGFWFLLLFVGLPMVGFCGLVGVAFLQGLASGIRQTSPAENWTTRISRTGALRISVPANWREADNARETDEFDLGEATRDRPAHFMVFSQAKHELGPKVVIEDLAKTRAEDLAEGGAEGLITNGQILRGPTSMTIGGNPAVQFEVRGTTKQGNAIFCLLTVIEGRDSIHTATGWGYTTKLTKQRPLLKRVIESIEETSAPLPKEPAAREK